MKIIVAISVDLVHAPLGQRSRLAAELCGRPVLRRTVERALKAKRPAQVHVLAPAAQHVAVSDLLAGLDVAIERVDAPPAPYAQLVRAGRQWGLDGWRGGIGGLCWFDEDLHAPVLAALATRQGADAVACVPGHAALIAPDLIDAMIDHYAKFSHLLQMTFTIAPPGLAPALFATSLIAELAPTGQPPGPLLTYRPESPAPDLTGKDACYRPAAVVSELRGRLCADTWRSFDRMRRLIEAGADEWSAEQIARFARERLAFDVAPVPEEIEIELTTQDPLAATTVLRPRGESVGRRGPMSLEHVRRIADLLSLDKASSRADDVRIVLGGFGDPFEHPQVVEIVRMLRDAGAMAIAIRTTGLAGDEALDEALFALPVDVLSVTLDAATREGHRRVHGVDGFERVASRIERWTRWRTERRQVRPLIVPEMIKAKQTFGEMEAFFDDWTRRLGWAVIHGYSHYARQRPDHAVMPMAPPRRVPCRRLFTRMMVLADGKMVACDQDYGARRPLGQLGQMSLLDAWRGELLSEMRSRHRLALYDVHPLCPQCTDWFRP